MKRRLRDLFTKNRFKFALKLLLLITLGLFLLLIGSMILLGVTSITTNEFAELMVVVIGSPIVVFIVGGFCYAVGYLLKIDENTPW